MSIIDDHNTVSLTVRLHIRLFADDCLLYRTIANISDTTSLQADLNQLMAWADKWQIRCNASKCSTLRVSRKRNLVMQPYTMMNTKLTEVKHHLYLGVELRNNLSWGIHINYTVGKAIRVLNFPLKKLVRLSKEHQGDCIHCLSQTSMLNTLVLCGTHISNVMSTIWNRYKLIENFI